MKKPKKASPLEAAIRSYLGAYVAARDAHRLIDIARSVATEEPLKVMYKARNKAARFESLLQVVAAKEALDRIEIYSMDPDRVPDGRTADEAYTAACLAVCARYARGRCSLCGGRARACAQRHAEGRSCA